MTRDTHTLLTALLDQIQRTPSAPFRQVWTYAQLCHVGLDHHEATDLLLSAGIRLTDPGSYDLRDTVRGLLRDNPPASATVPCGPPTVEIPPPNPTRDVASRLACVLAELRDLEVVSHDECSVPVANHMRRLAMFAGNVHREVDRAAGVIERGAVAAGEMAVSGVAS